MLIRPPGLSESDLEKVIEDAWGGAVTSLDYRPVGFGSHHWVAADNRGLRHFVTVDELSAGSRIGDEVSVRGLHLRPALTAACDLHSFGCTFVVAPIVTKDGDPFVQFDRYVVALFPFMEGQGFAFEESFGETDRERVLDVVAALHRVPLTAIRAPATDGFRVPWLDQLDHSMLREPPSSGPYAAVASQLLMDHEAAIRRRVARYWALVARHLEDPGPLVVTHGEIHPGNVMVTTEGWVLVDWDTALSPRQSEICGGLHREEVDRSSRPMPTRPERLPTNGSSTSMTFGGTWPRSRPSRRSSGSRTKTPRTAGEDWRSSNR